MFRIFLIAIISVGVSITGQIVLKLGVAQMGEIKSFLSLNFLIKVFINPLIIFSLFLYASSFILWVAVLSKAQLSAVYPLLAIPYIVVPLAGLLIFHEPISATRWIGIVIVCLGLLIIMKS